MKELIISTYLLGIIPCLFIIFFFWYHGAFKLPWYTYIPLLFNFFVASIQTFSLLPLDVTLSLYLKDDYLSNKVGILLIYFYWISMFLGWLFTPTITSIYTYDYNLTTSSKILSAIWYNIKWYLWAFYISILSFIFLLFFTNLKIIDIIPFIMALSNTYGLLLLCLLLGHGFIELPRTIWKFSNPEIKKNYYLHRIQNEYEILLKLTKTSKLILNFAENSKDQIQDLYSKIFLININKRILKLENCLLLIILSDDQLKNIQPDNNYLKWKNIKWNELFENELEDFLKDIDEITNLLDQTSHYIIDSSNKAEKCILELNNFNKFSFKFIFK